MDEKFFASDPRFKENPETEKLYMTLGGAPDTIQGPFGNLIGNENRRLDALTALC